jgi:hypothetical protein
MPFGIQTKGLVVGVVLGAVVIPRVLGALASKGK